MDKAVIKQPAISPRNIIDQTFIDTNLQCLNLNNLYLYALNIVSNTDILDFANTTKAGSSYFLGASSSSTDLRNNDLTLAKDNSFPIQIDPFSTVDKIHCLINYIIHRYYYHIPFLVVLCITVV